MKQGLSKRDNTTGTGRTRTIKRCSVNSGKHPYLRAEFWQNPANQFWNSQLYSEESKRQLATILHD